MLERFPVTYRRQFDTAKSELECVLHSQDATALVWHFFVSFISIKQIRMTTLLELWRDKKDFFTSKSFSQIIAMTGKGELKDGNNTSKEIRDFLSQIPSEKLTQFTHECLTDGFKDSGLALQETINQYGKRLGFEVEHGLYRGKKNEIGFDGIWKLKNEHSFIVEIKTTDAYRMNLDTFAAYKEKLIEAGQIDKNKSSILIIVGRQDTGDLEAQIRGSRHSWDIRLISIDALTKLLTLRETVNDNKVLSQINEVLKPLEYTKLDQLIELIFITSLDNQIEVEEQEVTIKALKTNLTISENEKDAPVDYHDNCVERVSRFLKKTLIKQSKSTYKSSDNTTAISCAVSKTYKTKQSDMFWYAFHPYQQEFLGEYENSFVSFGCGNPETIVAIPFKEFSKWTKNMNRTERPTRSYWHVKIHKMSNGKLEIEQPLSKTSKRADISKYLIK